MRVSSYMSFAVRYQQETIVSYVAVQDVTFWLPLGLSIYEFPTWANEKFKKTKKVPNHHPFSVRRAQYDIIKSWHKLRKPDYNYVTENILS